MLAKFAMLGLGGVISGNTIFEKLVKLAASQKRIQEN